MIVWGAIKISAFTESITQKGEGREMITNAIIGIVLLLGSYLILRTVNPRIVSLGEMLSPATVPQNTTATTSLAAAPESCGDAASIAGVEGVPIGNAKPDDGGNTCKYRKLYIYKDGFHITPDNDFYMSLKDIDIKPQSIIWTYPYFVKGKGASSARCVVYAYREPGNPGATFSSLEPGIEPCVLTGKQLDGYTGGAGDEQSGSASAMEATLNTHHVTLSSSGNCRAVDNPACTSLEGMPQSVINYLSSLGDWCALNGCSVVMTGGTEVGHQTHGQGKPVFDLRSDVNTNVLGKKLNDDGVARVICTAAVDPDQKYKKNCSSYTEAVRHFHVAL
jgi:hypothetical protein